jgi:hypothetical protein
VNRAKRAVCLALLILLLTTGWTPSPQGQETVVLGQVTNGTDGEGIPVALMVTLHVFSGMEETGVYTTTAIGDGPSPYDRASFRFEDLTLEDGNTLVARVVYRGVVYLSDFVTFEPGRRELTLPVTVYEGTEDPSTVLVSQLHVFLSVVQERLQVGEYYLIANTGDRTYVGVENPETGRRETLSFTLPEGVENLRFERSGLGERYLERDRGFVDTEPILPGAGTAELFFTYELPYREGMQLDRVFHTPVESVVLVLADEGVTLEGAGLTLAGMLDTQMGPALSYTAGPLMVGDSLSFVLAAESREASVAPVRDDATGVMIGAVVLAASVLAAYWLWRPPIFQRRRTFRSPGRLDNPPSHPGGRVQPSPPLGRIGGGRSFEPVPARARSLVESIAVLDEDVEAGRITEEAYRQERDILKERLRALLEE